jgi:hypothetical protein
MGMGDKVTQQEKDELKLLINPPDDDDEEMRPSEDQWYPDDGWSDAMPFNTMYNHSIQYRGDDYGQPFTVEIESKVVNIYGEGIVSKC